VYCGKWRSWLARVLLPLILFFFLGCGTAVKKVGFSNGKSRVIRLPLPGKSQDMELNRAIESRHSIREFSGEDVPFEMISLLLWSAVGRGNGGSKTDAVTGATGVAPSAGAIYPFRVYVVMKSSVYRYNANENSLELIRTGVRPEDVSKEALGQEALLSPLIIVLACDFRKTEAKYGVRAERYVYMEAGHIAQNIILESTSLGIGSVTIGAFNDDGIKRILGFEAEKPLYLIPVGKPAS